ncbi:UNVERIFIED_CONTAM: hypothetical protein GTU68_053756 [Idotea baltica]|nr:hypothetical protein [Idotea baltica]
MSVSVSGLTKIYGKQKAVDNITFDVDKGQILGFLGPNGAGKSTTMKMITSYISLTEGSASVCGYDVVKNPIEVKRHIGYLPEHNPLYKDMYVREYLQFVGKIYQVRNLKARVQEMIEKTGLELEQKKLIGSLSKGYRQRVGLAQAMMHDPDVLILDEPTSGLDPNQLAEIRGLISSLGKEKAVILSTHIMQEVKALCDRVIIINRGKLIVDKTTDHLSAEYANKNLIQVQFLNSVKEEELKALNGVVNVRQIGSNTFELESNRADVKVDLFNWAVRHNNPLIGMQSTLMSIEDIFRKVTN